MKVGVIGNGGREHALCSSLKNSDKIKQIYLLIDYPMILMFFSATMF